MANASPFATANCRGINHMQESWTLLIRDFHTAYFNVCLQGVESQRGEAAKALLSWPAAAWGAAASLLLSPLAALAVPAALGNAAAAPGLALGLAAWFCGPPTLPRALALTQVGSTTVEDRGQHEWTEPVSVVASCVSHIADPLQACRVCTIF